MVDGWNFGLWCELGFGVAYAQAEGGGQGTGKHEYTLNASVDPADEYELH